MKRVRIEEICDNHIGNIEIPATIERTVSLDGGPVIVLDLCEECDSTFMEPFIALLDKGVAKEHTVTSVSHPKRSRAKRVDPNDTTCRVCGRVSRSRGGLGKHVRDTHQMGVKEMSQMPLWQDVSRV